MADILPKLLTLSGAFLLAASNPSLCAEVDVDAIPSITIYGANSPSSPVFQTLTNQGTQGFGYAEVSKLDDVTLVNLKLTRKISGFANGETYLSVHNLLNRDYSLETGYPMPGITVLIGCRLQFQ